VGFLSSICQKSFFGQETTVELHEEELPIEVMILVF
jgi:hypothetical protein